MFEIENLCGFPADFPGGPSGVPGRSLGGPCAKTDFPAADFPSRCAAGWNSATPHWLLHSNESLLTAAELSIKGPWQNK